jgi:hypothetical protein
VIPGVAESVVERYGESKLRRIIHPRSGGPWAFQYDRGPVFDGTNVTAPCPCSRHASDFPKKRFLAVRLLEEHAAPDGTKWREVESLPDVLMVAGHPGEAA